MNQGVTIGYGEAGPRVLVGPEVPLREQIRAAKRLKAEDAPDMERIEVWGRDNGLIKRRRLKARESVAAVAAPEIPDDEVATDQARPEPLDEDSPVADPAPRRKPPRKAR